MRNFIAHIALLLLSVLPVAAQQQATYAQYMFNGLAINPAYAGSHEALSASFLARFQNVGLPGAPTTQTVAIHTPLASQRVARGGRRLDLTPKEYALLVFFLRHADEVLSRTRLYAAVWDERYDGESNTLEVHVKEVRRKLEAHGPRLLWTVRGRGYRFGSAGDDP